MAEFFVGDDLAVGDDDELMGLDEILGDDDDDLGSDIADILGGRPRRRSSASAKKLKLARTVALARATGGAMLRRKEPTSFREQPLPFQNTPLTITAAAPTQTLLAQPQRDFRVKRLIIPSSQAASFVVTDLSVSQEPQLVAPGAIAGQFFSEVGVGLALKGRTANLGSLISLTVTNISGLDVANFAPAILGDVVM